ncbi:MAG: glutathione S-transferase C-terminal domain-containing protein [Bifidobacteriaceae bacterium]|jgi:putative glutathione S-transferase|nr:glutathione S-transferase C-terminal domain-containing protein [Bifidobacteriaceae bacterium]
MPSATTARADAIVHLPPTLPGPPPAAGPLDLETYGPYTGGRRPLTTGQSAPGTRADNRPLTIYPFNARISPDGPFPPEPGRYVLYVALGCPWAHRQVLVTRLKGLTGAIGLGVVDYERDGRGWAFREGEDLTLDPYNHFQYLSEAYEATEPGYDGHISVPVLWDTKTRRIVANYFPTISYDLATQFDPWATRDIDLYPPDLRPDIDALIELIYQTVNNGVYRTGTARTQATYDQAVKELFGALDLLDSRLETRRYLFGDRLTLADIHLYPTLARFDVAYAITFKANLRWLVDYPNLWDYARHLYQQPDFRQTTRLRRYAEGYAASFTPSRIAPAGPLVDWDAPTTRATPSSNH